MMPIAKPSIHVSDSIHFKSIDTGGNSAGNGGDGSFKGYVVNAPTLSFDPSNKAYGADVSVKTGDHVDQKAYWDAGKASAEVEKWSKGDAEANANSNGDQSSKSGHDTSKVYANTEATQKNWLEADQHQEVMAGIGGHGGDGNMAIGGNVDLQIDTSI
jgi:hypothetical protein